MAYKLILLKVLIGVTVDCGVLQSNIDNKRVLATIK